MREGRVTHHRPLAPLHSHTLRELVVPEDAALVQDHIRRWVHVRIEQQHPAVAALTAKIGHAFQKGLPGGLVGNPQPSQKEQRHLQASTFKMRLS